MTSATYVIRRRMILVGGSNGPDRRESEEKGRGEMRDQCLLPALALSHETTLLLMHS